MALSTKVYLLFLSLICSIFMCKAQELDSGEDLDSLLTHRWAFDITMEKGHISGVMITKEDDSSIIGTMINEFGVSALSFVYDKHKSKLRLQDVMSMLNKWYIKRVLKNDITFCLHVLYDTPYKKKHKYVLSVTTTNISITNTQRKLTYSFKPFDSETENGTSE